MFSFRRVHVTMTEVRISDHTVGSHSGSGNTHAIWIASSRRQRGHRPYAMLLLFVGCLTSQQHASESQGRIFSDKFTCCHTEIEAADQTFYLTHSQYTDTGLTSPTQTTQSQAPGRVATGEPMSKSLVWLHPVKSRRKRIRSPDLPPSKLDQGGGWNAVLAAYSSLHLLHLRRWTPGGA